MWRKGKGMRENYLITLFAPRGHVSPDAESAELVVSAGSEAEARAAAERLVRAESSSLETYVEWHGDDWIERDAAAAGVHAWGIAVVSVEPTGRAADVKAEVD